jgi:hypothetical protein
MKRLMIFGLLLCTVFAFGQKYSNGKVPTGDKSRIGSDVLRKGTKPNQILMTLGDSTVKYVDSDTVSYITNIHDSIAILPTTNLFASYMGSAKLFYVTDSLRGGFFRLENSTTASDSGTVFNSGVSGKKFIRSYSDFIYPEWFGAVGDGVTDDKDAVQLSMNHKNVNIRFKEGKEYFLRERVFVTQNKNIDLNGAKITINTGASPTNMVFYVKQNVLSSYTFTQASPIVTGQIFILLPTGVASNFTAGDRISLELGEDPFDGGMYHCGFNTKINRINGDSIFIDRAFEYSINLTAKTSKIEKITGIDFVDIKNGVLEYGAGIIADMLIFIYKVDNVTISHITHNSPIFVNVAQGENITISTITGKCNNLHGAAGRFCTAWQSRNLKIFNVSNTQSKGFGPFLLLESVCKNVYVNNVVINNLDSIDVEPTSSIFHIAGSSSDIRIYNAIINSRNIKHNFVTQNSSVEFSNHALNYKNLYTLDPKYFSHGFTLNSVVFNKKQFHKKIKTIKNAGGERWFTKDTYISEIKFKAYNVKSGTNIYLLNTPGNGFNITNAELNDNVILVKNMAIGSLGGINYKSTNDPNPDNYRIVFYADSGDEGVIDVYGQAFVKDGSFMYYNNDLDYYSEPTTTVGGASSTAANANAISGGLVAGQSYWWDDGNGIFLMKVK